MVVSVAKEEKDTLLMVGELYTNDEVILMCTEVKGSNFVGVILHIYPCCKYDVLDDCRIGAIKHIERVIIGSEPQIWNTEGFRKFKGELTIKSI